jgi:hypothetical protein
VLTYYDILGLAPSASHEELRLAYHRKAQLLHPDHHTGAPPDVVAEAERSLRDLNEAWAILKDPQQRRAYDERLGRAGHTRHAGMAQSWGSPPAEPSARPSSHVRVGLGVATVGLVVFVRSFEESVILALIGLALLVGGMRHALRGRYRDTS